MLHPARHFMAGALVLTFAATRGAAAQHTQHDKATPRPTAGASAILLGTVADPGVEGRTLAEGYITQPVIDLTLPHPSGRITGSIMLNLEGITLERGELNAGMHGEGYVDRRHPHTWLHEAVVTAYAGRSMPRVSITVGKGFVPFGTDDPMSRGFVKYPVNHHLAQLLERAGLFGAVALGSFVLEGGAFNGDEPTSPWDWPEWGHIGDSWSLRATGRSSRGIEVQASLADVVSPEIAQGGGLDHRKWSASARYGRNRHYAMAEWARTSEREEGREAFAFSSVLAELSVPAGKVQLAFRAERSERPESERLSNVFRSPVPHSDLNILGRTRWHVLSASASRTFHVRGGTLVPLVEVSTQRPVAMDSPAIFEPRQFYGSARLWSYTAGVRAGIGSRHGRMGRYGVAASTTNHLEHR